MPLQAVPEPHLLGRAIPAVVHRIDLSAHLSQHPRPLFPAVCGALPRAGPGHPGAHHAADGQAAVMLHRVQSVRDL